MRPLALLVAGALITAACGEVSTTPSDVAPTFSMQQGLHLLNASTGAVVPAEVALDLGATLHLVLGAGKAEMGRLPVQWSSSDHAVVELTTSTTGGATATALDFGRATVTAQVGQIARTVTIDVSAHVTVVSSGSSSGGFWENNTWTPSASESIVLASDVATQLLDGPTVITTMVGGSVSGNIVVEGDITWAANTLTLRAGRDITIDGALTGSGPAALSLEYGQGTTAADNTGVYLINTFITLKGTSTFSLQGGSDGVPDVRTLPTCTRTCSFLSQSDTAAVITKYGSKVINGAANATTWIYVQAPPELTPFDSEYFSFVMMCISGKGTLYYPISSAQSQYFLSGGHVTDPVALDEWTTAERACRTWEQAGPIYSFFDSDSVDGKGYYVKFVPTAGASGTAYQIMTILSTEKDHRNEVLWALDHVINIHP